MASLTKHCLMLSPKESKALSGRIAMSVKACWSRPIADLDGKERDKPCEYQQLVNRHCWHTHTSFCDVSFTAMHLYHCGEKIAKLIIFELKLAIS